MQWELPTFISRTGGVTGIISMRWTGRLESNS
jgi:hypothetical protein